ncbi:MAG TPA: cobyric acid synthase, partial [Xanthomonadaceae bacterium]|nr:cobyric acid synthase [Xanthomonadaceae bacterium]
VGDIDRGHVIAALVGAHAVLDVRDRARIRGFIVNKFRGDVRLLDPGLRFLEERTGKPVLGVLPYLHGLHLEAEDALPRERERDEGASLRIAVPALPRISNHTDFDALRAHPQLALRFVGPGEAMPPCDLIVLPGSKATRADLAWLRAQGFDGAIARHLRYGGKVLGICGGLQMLGHAVHDPDGVEGAPGSSAGLGWLELDTTLAPYKQLRAVRGGLEPEGEAVAGYEIHCGVSSGAALRRPFALLEDGRADGARDSNDRVRGTYLHGVFDSPPAQAALLRWAGLRGADAVDIAALREASLDRLADCVASHLDTARLAALLGLEPRAREDACAP